MTVGDEDVIGFFDVVEVDIGQRVVGEERVKPDCLARSFDAEAGMSVISQSYRYHIPPMILSLSQSRITSQLFTGAKD